MLMMGVDNQKGYFCRGEVEVRVLLLSLECDKVIADVLEAILINQNKTVTNHILNSNWKNTLTSNIETFEHLIIVYHPLLEQMGWFYFAAGWILGRKSPGILYETKGITLPPLFNNLPRAGTPGEVDEYFRKEGELWLIKKKKEDATEALGKLGYSYNSDAFAFAITQGDIKAFNHYLSGGLSPDSKDARGTPLICLAARYHHARLVELLIEAGANIDAVSQDRENTALMDAASFGDAEICEIMVNAGAQLDHVSKNGQTALMLAIGQQSVEASEILINAGSNPLLKDKLGMSACQYAKLFKMTDILSLCEEAECQWEEDDDS